MKRSEMELRGAVPELSETELSEKFAKAHDPERARRDFLAQTVKPRDRYGRRRIFDVISHEHPNRAERRARARAAGVLLAPALNRQAGAR